jgi:hypothetical protein
MQSAVISILSGFAKAASRDASAPMVEMTEREVHRHGDRPVGNGWVRVSSDPCGYSVWERTRAVRAAS